MNWGNRLRCRKNCIIKGEEESGLFQSASFILSLSCSVCVALYSPPPTSRIWLFQMYECGYWTRGVREIKLSKAFSWNESLELNWMSVSYSWHFIRAWQKIHSGIRVASCVPFSAANLKCILTPKIQNKIVCRHVHAYTLNVTKLVLKIPFHAAPTIK